jgi:hypothetical protein
MNKQSILGEVFRITDTILNDCDKDNIGISWNTYSMNNMNETVYGKSEMIYVGNSGILLYLLELHKITQDDTILNVIKKSADWILNYCREHETNIYSFYTGRLGSIYVLLRVFEATKDEKYLTSALSLVDGINMMHERSNISDFLNGISGEILACIQCHSITGDNKFLKIINDLIKILLDNAFIGKQGLYWDRSFNNVRGLCGFSHGASGIGFVFLELALYFRNDAFLWIADQAFFYEAAFYNKIKNNWPDFRKGIYGEEEYAHYKTAYLNGNLNGLTNSHYMSAWCHGNIGIGMARIRAVEILKKNKYKLELDNILRASYSNFKRSKNKSYNLCHGYGGNADLLLEAYKLFGDSKYINSAAEIAMGCIKLKDKMNYHISGMKNVKDGSDHTLLLGNAGIAFFLLKTLYPHKMQSVLMPVSKRNHKINSGSNSLKGFKHIILSTNEIKKIVVRKQFPKSIFLAEHFNKQSDPKKEKLDIDQLTAKDIQIFFQKKGIENDYFKGILDMECKILTFDANLNSFMILFLENAISYEFNEKEFESSNLILKLCSGIKLIKSKINFINLNANNNSRKEECYYNLVRINDKGTLVDDLSVLSFEIIKSFYKENKVKMVVEKLANVFKNELVPYSKIKKIIIQQIINFIKIGIFVPLNKQQ